MLNQHALFLAALGLLLAGCGMSPATPTPASTPTSALQARLQDITAVPTLAIEPTQTATFMPAATASSTPTPLPPTPTATPSLPAPTPLPATTVAPLPTAPPVPTPTVMLPRVDHYVLNRPIARAADLVDWVDRTYPYGSTQLGLREIHTGVEFVNVRHTPVLAAADGRVIFAGADAGRRLGPQYDYYGNVVLLQHELTTPEGLPVFTLYGHLQDIQVQPDDFVFAGATLGTVGDSGIAIGPHLHFEVRVGDGFDFFATRNPDLWLRPYPQFGTLAGRITSADGQWAYGRTILVRADGRTRETYSYGAERVNADATWQENFTLGDLPVGSYEVIVAENGQARFRQTIAIENGRTTFIEIQLPN